MEKTADFKDVWLALLIAALAIALTLLWFSFDHHFPAQDEAEHIMNSITSRDLLAHIHPFSHHWWYQCLTVNRFYPPFAYFVNGSFLLCFGQSRFTEQLAMSFFSGLMTASIYALTRLLSGTRIAAATAAVCLYVYPAISHLSHTFFLEIPQIAMTAFAIMTFMWWRTRPNLNWWRSILTAVTLGMACLTKQLVAAYLLPIGLYFLSEDLLSMRQKKISVAIKLKHILLIGLITALIGLPFIIINYKFGQEMTSALLQSVASKSIHSSYLHKLIIYLNYLPEMMSPFLYIIFLLAILFVSKNKQATLLPISLSAVSGLCLTCALSGFGLDYRYITPVLIATAVYSGFFIDKLYGSPKYLYKAIAVLIIALAVFNYAFFNFVPYPLACCLPWQTHLSYEDNPMPETDCGHASVIDTIKKIDGDKPVYLNILANSKTLHTHAFALLLKEKQIDSITPTSSRYFTIAGDKVEFDRKTALYPQWYLWKTDNTGYPFYDKQSQSNYKQLIDFISNSGNYRQIIKRPLPDGSNLLLYRRVF